jgi:hypothetical protein
LFALAAASVMALAGAQVAVMAQSRTTAPSTSPAYLRTNAEEVSRRIHRALFSRDNDGSLNDTINEVRAGRTRQRVDALVATTEFKTARGSQPPQQILHQIAQGMVGRAPTAAETTRFRSWMTAGRITDIVMDYAGSVEFRNSLPAPGDVLTPTGGGTTAVDAGRAADCQEQVVEHMRDHTQGIVLLRFESAEAEGGGVRGVAFDVIDNNRRLTYRCDGGPSYAYDDGRNTRNAPNEGDFPSERVRACQNNVRSRVQSQRAGIEVTFESAGLMSSGDQVRGLGFEKKPNGQNFHYRCQLNGTSVSSASFNWR